MAADPIVQERREECRRSVLGFLAVRQATAHHPKTIRRALNAGHEHDFGDEEISAALGFLEGLDLVKACPDDFGATLYYKATSAGVLAHERGLR